MTIQEFDPLEKAREGLEKEAMKQRIVNIIRSYHNATDVLAEPIQNSMDELVRAQDEGLDDADKIEIHIDTKTNKIIVIDSGRGIQLDDLRDFIAPDNTDKRRLFNEGKVRGHKGVGLTFLAYGFNKFEVESRTISGEHYRLQLEEGREWVEDRSRLDPPKATVEEDISDGKLDHRGTRLELKVDKQSQPRVLSRAFNNPTLTASILEMQTAIGVVPPKVESHPNINAKLVYTNSGGKVTTKQLNTSFRYPHKDLPTHHNVLDLGDYIERNAGEVEPKAKDKKAYHAVYRFLDPEKVKEAVGQSGGEVLMDPQEVVDFIENHQVHVYGLFSYSTTFRDDLTDHWEVAGNKKFHYPGVRIATDGMISSWKRDVSLSMAAGNKDRIWLVYHFEDIEPDMGRKDFPPEVHDVINVTEQSVSSDLIKKALPFLRPAPKGGTSGPTSPVKPAVKAHERRKNPIDPPTVPSGREIPLISEPEEEQDVVAVFNQLLGLDLLNCYKPVYFSGTDDYDAYFEYDSDSVPPTLKSVLPGDEDLPESQTEGVAEFKYEGTDLLQDIVNDTKSWSDMQFLVCWKIERDERSMGGDVIQFSEVSSTTDRRYAGVTHLASLQSMGQEPIYTIALKEVLQLGMEDSENR